MVNLCMCVYCSSVSLLLGLKQKKLTILTQNCEETLRAFSCKVHFLILWIEFCIVNYLGLFELTLCLGKSCCEICSRLLRRSFSTVSQKQAL